MVMYLLIAHQLYNETFALRQTRRFLSSTWISLSYTITSINLLFLPLVNIAGSRGQICVLTEMVYVLAVPVVLLKITSLLGLIRCHHGKSLRAFKISRRLRSR